MTLLVQTQSSPKTNVSAATPSLRAADLVGGGSAVRAAVFCGLCGCLTCVLYPYAFGLLHNHAIQLPILIKLIDAGAYPGDRFMDVASGYHTVFWAGISQLVQHVEIRSLFLAGHLMTVMATICGVFALARRLFPTQVAAPSTAVWLFVWWTPSIGGESLHWFYWTHTAVALAVGIWTLVAALGRHWWLAFGLAGLMFNIHAMQAVYLLGALTVGLIWDQLAATGAFCPELRGPHGATAGTSVEKRGRWRGMLQAIVGPLLFVLLSLPTAVAILRDSGVASALEIADILRAFFPSHFFASSFPTADWFAVAVIVGLWVWCVRRLPSARATDLALIMSAALLAFMGVGGLLSEVWPAAVLLKLHVFRASSYFVILTLCLTAGCLSVASNGARWTGWLAATWPVAPILGLGFSERHFVLSGGKPQVLFCVGSAALLLTAALWIRTRKRVCGLTMGSVAIVLVGTALVFRWFYMEHNYYHRGSVMYHNGPWLKVQQWAREQTRPDELFLTPPYLEGFRVFSLRPIVGEWKDGCAVMWNGAYADYWRNWYANVGGEFKDSYRCSIDSRLKAAWTAKPQADIEALARQYGATYILLETEQARHWQGAPLYENDRFMVYKTGSFRSDGAPAMSISRAVGK